MTRIIIRECEGSYAVHITCGTRIYSETIEAKNEYKALKQAVKAWKKLMRGTK